MKNYNLYIMLKIVTKKKDCRLYEEAYKGYIQKRRDLKNGWRVLWLTNSVGVLFKNGIAKITVGKLKRVVEAKDGKFMYARKDGRKVVYDQNGNRLSDLDFNAQLFSNGWYVTNNDNRLGLFNEYGVCVCDNIVKAEVYNDGWYLIIVPKDGDANKAGFFMPNGERFLFTNNASACRLKNNWFITDGLLYDCTGECLVDANSNFLNSKLLAVIKKVLPKHS